MKNNNTNLILVISIVSLLAFSFAFGYLLNVIKNKNNHISAVSITLEKKIVEKNNLTALEKKMTELVDTQKKISSYFVDTSNIEKFVEYLEGMGLSNGTEVSVKSVDVEKGDKTKMLVNLRIKGNFAKTTKTIAILENSPYNIVINYLYLNKEVTVQNDIVDIIPGAKTKTKVVPIVRESLWQADVSFNVLNL